MTAMARPRGENLLRFDWLDARLLLATLALLGLGVVMVTSASMHLGARSGDSLQHLHRHLFAMGLGLGCALMVAWCPVRWWAKASTLVFFLGLFALLLVLLPGIGKLVNGATRWIQVGPLNLQPSEFVKLAAILYLAGYLVRRQLEVTHSIWGFVKPMLLLVLACALILLQPDFGTTSVLLATALGMLFLAGAPLWQFIGLLGIAAAALVALIVTSPYRLERVTSFLNPWADPLGSGYQLSQALIAFGRGEWSGVGLGSGIQKQFYLPEAHTDFLMAVIGEEFGLIGTLTVIGLFAVFVWRAFAIGSRAEVLGRRYSAYVAYGVGLWVGMQAFLNIGVNVGMLPTKGLTLPFMSYGSNSLMVCMVATAMLLRIHFETQQADPGEDEPWLRA